MMRIRGIFIPGEMNRYNCLYAVEGFFAGIVSRENTFMYQLPHASASVHAYFRT